MCHADGTRMARRKVGRMAGKKGHRSWGRIRRLPSKRYQASYVGPDLVRHNAPSTFTTKMDAEAWLHAERRSMELESWVAPACGWPRRRPRRSRLASTPRPGLSIATLSPAPASVIRPCWTATSPQCWAAMPLKNITPESVRAWFASAGHRACAAQQPRLRAAACDLQDRHRDGLIVANPCNIPRVMNPPRKREPVILSVAEVAALADAIRPERLKPSCWCRRGAACAGVR